MTTVTGIMSTMIMILLVLAVIILLGVAIGFLIYFMVKNKRELP